MKHSRRNDAGFTLIELVVAIAAAIAVTAAATTVLLLAIRVNNQTADTASHHYTVRALLTAMENAAAEGNIKGIISNEDSWYLLGASEEQVAADESVEDGKNVMRPIFSYDKETETIYTNETKVLEGVISSSASFSNDRLLTVSIETKDGVYTSSILCRVSVGLDGNPELDDNSPETPLASRKDFLAILQNEFGSRGKIRGEETYYSEWYIKEAYIDGIGPGGWDKETSWCGCYVSWSLTKAGMIDPTTRLDAKARKIDWFAEVDEFMEFFRTTNYGEWNQSWLDVRSPAPVADPKPGDLIFFGVIRNDGVYDANHMGVVLDVDALFVYTIEGNSNGRVEVCRYPKNDSSILGYGVLTWKEDAISN